MAVTTDTRVYFGDVDQRLAYPSSTSQLAGANVHHFLTKADPSTPQGSRRDKLKRSILFDIAFDNSSLASNAKMELTLPESVMGSSSGDKPSPHAIKTGLQAQLLTLENDSYKAHKDRNIFIRAGYYIASFIKAVSITLPKPEGKNLFPIYYPNVIFAWTTTLLEGFVKHFGALLTHPTRYFWNKAQDILIIKEGDINRWRVATPGEKTSRVFKTIGVALLWIIIVPIPILWAIGQVFYVAGNALRELRHLVDGITEFVASIGSLAIWAFSLGNFKPAEYFSPLIALKEIALSILFLVPIAALLAISFIPIVGQTVAPGLSALLADLGAAIKSMILLTVFAPATQLVDSFIEKPDWVLGKPLNVSKYPEETPSTSSERKQLVKPAKVEGTDHQVNTLLKKAHDADPEASPLNSAAVTSKAEESPTEMVHTVATTQSSYNKPLPPPPRLAQPTDTSNKTGNADQADQKATPSAKVR